MKQKKKEDKNKARKYENERTQRMPSKCTDE